MKKIILIYANCCSPSAKGDFALAGSLAKDIKHQLLDNDRDIDVVLASTLNGLTRFKALYGDPVNGRLMLDGKDIGLCALELFDAIENNVIAFIEANRCHYAPEDILRRVLAPGSKFLLVGAPNQQLIENDFHRAMWLLTLLNQQPKIFEDIHPSHVLLSSCGLQNKSLGLPSIASIEHMAGLETGERAFIPMEQYGFIYLNGVNPEKTRSMLFQYSTLTKLNQYVLIGKVPCINTLMSNYASDISSSTAVCPHIIHYESVSNKVMRHLVSQSHGELVISTGVMSTIEAMQDAKLSYYEDMDINIYFVKAYLSAVEASCKKDDSLTVENSSWITELSRLLFDKKPLENTQYIRIQELLLMTEVSQRLITINKMIIKNMNGNTARALLTFIDQPVSDLQKLDLLVRAKKRFIKPTESWITDDQLLRRAAAYGDLFALKVALQYMKEEINRGCTKNQLTALHWALYEGKEDCAKMLVFAGALLNVQDRNGQTPLHIAIKKMNKNMIRLLIESHAPLNIKNNLGELPCEQGGVEDILSFVEECRARIATTTVVLREEYPAERPEPFVLLEVIPIEGNQQRFLSGRWSIFAKKEKIVVIDSSKNEEKKNKLDSLPCDDTPPIKRSNNNRFSFCTIS